MIQLAAPEWIIFIFNKPMVRSKNYEVDYTDTMLQ